METMSKHFTKRGAEKTAKRLNEIWGRTDYVVKMTGDYLRRYKVVARDQKVSK